MSTIVPPPYPTAPPPATTKLVKDGVVIGSYDAKLEEFRRIALKYDIRTDFCYRLRQLEDFQIVIVCDDSSSMTNRVTSVELFSAHSGGGIDPFSPRKTRWDELKDFTNIATSIATIMDRDGIDLYFLNRGTAKNVTNVDMINEWFHKEPSGSTPLVSRLQDVFHDYASVIKEKKLLIIIATDGEPDEGRMAFVNTLKNKPTNTFVSILTCTDDDSIVSYLNDIDRLVSNVDTVDDYRNEKNEILKAQGEAFHFTYGDYVVKTLLGSVDDYFDKLDEPSPAIRVPKETPPCCCCM